MPIEYGSNELDNIIDKMDIEIEDPKSKAKGKEVVREKLLNIKAGLESKLEEEPPATMVANIITNSVPDMLMGDSASTLRGMKNTLIKESSDFKEALRENGAADILDFVSDKVGKNNFIGKSLSKLSSALQPNKNEVKIDESVRLAEDTFARIAELKSEESSLEMQSMIAENTSKENHSLLVASRHHFNLAKYSSQMAESYYKKSIELKYKSLFKLKDIANTLKLSLALTTRGLEDVTHNVGISDFSKMSISDIITAQLRTRGANKIYDTVSNKLASPLDTFKRNVSRKIGGAKESVLSTLDMGTQMKDASSMMDGMGDMMDGLSEEEKRVMSKEALLASMAADKGKSVISRAIAGKAQNTELGSKVFGGFENILDNPYGYLTNKADNMEIGIGRDAVNKVASLFDPETLDTQPTLLASNKNNLDHPATFNNRALISITQVIPGLLSKILSSIKGSNEITYDYHKGEFIAKKKVKKILKEDIKGRYVKENHGAISKTVMTSLGAKGKLSDKEKEDLLLRMSNHKGNLDVRYVNEYSSLFDGLDEDTKSKYLNAFKGVNDSLSKKKGIHHTKRFNRLLTALSENKVDSRARIQDLINSGFEDELMKAGIIEEAGINGEIQIVKGKYKELNDLAILNAYKRETIDRDEKVNKVIEDEDEDITSDPSLTKKVVDNIIDRSKSIMKEVSKSTDSDEANLINKELVKETVSQLKAKSVQLKSKLSDATSVDKKEINDTVKYIRKAIRDVSNTTIDKMKDKTTTHLSNVKGKVTDKVKAPMDKDGVLYTSLEKLTDSISNLTAKIDKPKGSFFDKDGDGIRDNSWRDKLSRDKDKPIKEKIKSFGKEKKEEKKSSGLLGGLGLGAVGAIMLAVKTITSAIDGVKKLSGIGFDAIKGVGRALFGFTKILSGIGIGKLLKSLIKGVAFIPKVMVGGISRLLSALGMSKLAGKFGGKGKGRNKKGKAGKKGGFKLGRMGKFTLGSAILGTAAAYGGDIIDGVSDWFSGDKEEDTSNPIYDSQVVQDSKAEPTDAFQEVLDGNILDTGFETEDVALAAGTTLIAAGAIKSNRPKVTDSIPDLSTAPVELIPDAKEKNVKDVIKKKPPVETNASNAKRTPSSGTKGIIEKVSKSGAGKVLGTAGRFLMKASGPLQGIYFGAKAIGAYMDGDYDVAAAYGAGALGSIVPGPTSVAAGIGTEILVEKLKNGEDPEKDTKKKVKDTRSKSELKEQMKYDDLQRIKEMKKTKATKEMMLEANIAVEYIETSEDYEIKVFGNNVIKYFDKVDGQLVMSTTINAKGELFRQFHGKMKKAFGIGVIIPMDILDKKIDKLKTPITMKAVNNTTPVETSIKNVSGSDIVSTSSTVVSNDNHTTSDKVPVPETFKTEVKKPTMKPVNNVSSSNDIPTSKVKITDGVSEGDRILFEAISVYESKPGRIGYDVTIGYGKYEPRGSKPVSQMTISEVYKLQKSLIRNGAPSGAVGKFQFIPVTLREVVKKAKVKSNQVFSPQMQDFLILTRLNYMRGYRDWKLGKISDKTLLDNLAKEFASIVSPSKGRGWYDGDSAGNHAKNSVKNMLSVLARVRTKLGMPVSKTSYEEIMSNTSMGTDVSGSSMGSTIKSAVVATIEAGIKGFLSLLGLTKDNETASTDEAYNNVGEVSSTYDRSAAIKAIEEASKSGKPILSDRASKIRYASLGHEAQTFVYEFSKHAKAMGLEIMIPPYGGSRTVADQRVLFNRRPKVTWTMNSYHIGGRAVDIISKKGYGDNRGNARIARELKLFIASHPNLGASQIGSKDPHHVQFKHAKMREPIISAEDMVKDRKLSLTPPKVSEESVVKKHVDEVEKKVATTAPTNEAVKPEIENDAKYELPPIEKTMRSVKDIVMSNDNNRKATAKTDKKIDAMVNPSKIDVDHTIKVHQSTLEEIASQQLSALRSIEGKMQNTNPVPQVSRDGYIENKAEEVKRDKRTKAPKIDNLRMPDLHEQNPISMDR